ncbi:MAG: ACT domain-containing protein [Cyanobacteria bacterium]|nr:ACT domain-containing protein [Cyanobacteriota bacterium]
MGPAFSHSYCAAEALLESLALKQSDYAPQPYASLESLTEDFLAGHLASTLLPVENVIEGSVRLVWDALETIPESFLKNVVLVEFTFAIHHSLLVTETWKGLPQTQVVMSHPQALAQCRRWVQTHCAADLTWAPTASTSEAAFQLSELFKSDPLAASETAVLAHSTLTSHTGLRLAVPDCSDLAGNQTRFLWLQQPGQTPGQANLVTPSISDWKTTYILSVVDRPGALVEALQCFQSAGINLSRIESRPSRSQLGEYLFYLDAVHTNPAESSKLLEALVCDVSQHTRTLKSLGPYPCL